MSHTAPIDVTNQLAALVVGSMLPLGVNTRREKNSPIMSGTVAFGVNSSASSANPTHGVDEERRRPPRTAAARRGGTPGAGCGR